MTPDRVSGFTLLEMMVGMIIFVIGILGLSGMIIVQTKVTRSAKGIDESTTIVQSAVEALNNVTFSTLGTSTSLPTAIGLANGSIWTDGPLNKLGGTGTGPFLYYRSVVVCQNGMNIPAGATPKYCGGTLAGTYRPAELSCTTAQSPGGAPLSSREKLVRVLVGWIDRDGKCHYKNTDFLAFSW